MAEANAVPDAALHRVVIVGGGAGGLELATKLGNSLGRRRRADITLIERARTHFWKPHLHEIAAGSMDVAVYDTDYLAQSHWHCFRYRIGEMTGLDRQRRQVHVAAFTDEDGDRVAPPRTVDYDTLVICIGSRTNDFGTPGAHEYAIALDDPVEAERFHRRLVNAYMRAHTQSEPLRPEQLHVAIIGAGATGVELAAELHNTIRVLTGYGLESFHPETQIRIRVVEAGPRILPGLPEYIAGETLETLQSLGIEVLLDERVVEATAEHVKTASGRLVPAQFIVWAAGIRCPGVLKDLDGLESNRLNQLVVRDTLQATRDDDVFALGDCACVPWRGRPPRGQDQTTGKAVPPRAQSAHQMSEHLVKMIPRRMAGRPLKPFRYRDFGSLVSLGNYQSVGTLMGFVTGGTLRLEGLLAKAFYVSLYRLHVWALHGFWRMALDTLARMIRQQTDPKVKLH